MDFVNKTYNGSRVIESTQVPLDKVLSLNENDFAIGKPKAVRGFVLCSAFPFVRFGNWQRLSWCDDLATQYIGGFVASRSWPFFKFGWFVR